VSRQKRAETGQQEIIGEIKSDKLRYNGNKEPLFCETGCCQQRKTIWSIVKVIIA
jgi:hypothetical protein